MNYMHLCKNKSNNDLIDTLILLVKIGTKYFDPNNKPSIAELQTTNCKYNI